MTDSAPRPTQSQADAPGCGAESDDTSCPHGIADRLWCSYCLGRRPPTPINQPRHARHEGECDCGQGIQTGDLIVGWSDGLYRHEGCEP